MNHALDDSEITRKQIVKEIALNFFRRLPRYISVSAQRLKHISKLKILA
jgi:hypothetical protein